MALVTGAVILGGVRSIAHVSELGPGAGIENHDAIGRNVFGLDIVTQDFDVAGGIDDRLAGIPPRDDRRVERFRAHDARLTVAALSPDGSLLATAALWAVTLGSNPSFPLSVEAGLVLTVTLAVLVFSILAGLLSIRRIAKAEPAAAAQGTH